MSELLLERVKQHRKVRHGGLEPMPEVHRQRQFSFLMFFGGFPKAVNGQAKNLVGIGHQPLNVWRQSLPRRYG